MNKIIYKVIFTLGYSDDEESLMTGQRGDVLILDEEGNYYDPYYITLKRIEGEFSNKSKCYLLDKLVILHSVTKENIIDSIPYIHNWQFKKRWMPLKPEMIEKHYYPDENWVSYDIQIDI